ncbi:hypothetical protein JCM11251_004622 [Rhodosporidiobolus azoricus]
MSAPAPAPAATYTHFEDDHIRLMEEITSPPAQDLINQSGILSDERDTIDVLDSAAGAGVVTALLKGHLKEKKGLKIVMGDLEKVMLDLAQKRVDGQRWENVEVKEANALSLPFEDSSFDYVLVNFGVQLFPDQDKAIAESYRVLRSSSVFGYTAWTVVPFITLLRAVDPSFTVPPPFTAAVAHRSKLSPVLAKAGFSDIQIEDVQASRKWAGAQEFLDDLKVTMAGLFQDEARNQKLVQKLRAEQGEGEVELTWEGIAVTAKKA